MRYKIKKNLIWLSVFLLIFNNIFALSIVTKTVKPSGGDYTTIGGFENGYAKDLVTADEIVICEIYDKGSAYAESVFVDDGSWVTDMDHYIIFRAATVDRHNGIFGAGIVISPGSDEHGIKVTVDHTRFEWLEVTDWVNGGNDGSHDGINIQADSVYVSNCLVYNDGHGNNTSDAGGIQMEGTGPFRIFIENCIVYNIARLGVGLHGVTNCSLYISNTSVCSAIVSDNVPDEYMSIGASNDGNTNGYILARNCISMDAGASERDFFAGGGGAFGSGSNNLSSDATASDAGSAEKEGRTSSDIFLNILSGSENLHIKNTSACVDSGVDLGTTANIDIDGYDRNAGGDVWDIGADEEGKSLEVITVSLLFFWDNF